MKTQHSQINKEIKLFLKTQSIPKKKKKGCSVHVYNQPPIPTPLASGNPNLTSILWINSLYNFTEMEPYSLHSFLPGF